MKLPCTAHRQSSGEWLVRHSSRDLGTVEVRGPNRDAALEKMCGELRYRLEICPCTGELYRDVEIEIAT